MKMKKLAMAVITGLVACSVLAGCGGGSGDSKPTAKNLGMDGVASQEISIGSQKLKVYPVKNEAKVNLYTESERSRIMAYAGKGLIYANNKNQLTKLQWERDKVSLVKGDLGVISERGGAPTGSINPDAAGAYIMEYPKTKYYDDKANAFKELNTPTLTLIAPLSGTNKALVLSEQNQLYKYELNADKSLGKNLGEIRKPYKERQQNKDADLINSAKVLLPLEDESFLVGGMALMDGKSQSAGQAALYDKEGKLLTTYGTANRKSAEYLNYVRDAMVSKDKVMLLTGQFNGNVALYEKATGKFIGKANLSELLAKQRNAQMTATYLENNFALVAFSKDGEKRTNPDEMYIIELK